nr:brain-specific angiogenesis inhibitor 1-associated protein 2-like [Lytechinus pictus]
MSLHVCLQAQSVLHHRLPKWNESCDKSDKLPEECEDILSFDFSGPLETPLQVELRNSRRLYERNIMLAQNEERTKKSPQHEPASPKSPNESDRPLSVDVEPPQQPPPPSSTGVTSSYSATLPNIKKLGSSTHPSVHQLPPFQTNQQQQMIPPMTQPTTPSPPQQPPQQQPLQQPPQTQVPPNLAGRHSKSVKSPHHHLHAISQTMPRQTFMRRVSEAGDMMENEQKMPRVQAVYTHSATGENQLAFSEGDIIGLVGPKNNGWFYGHNYRTRRNGWFPITYTQPLADIAPKTNGTSNILNTKPVAASMDNLQSVGNDYPTPDYSGPGSPVTAASTLSLPQVGIAIPSTLSTPPTYTNPSTSASNNNGVENGGVKPSGLLMTAPVGVVEGEERNNIQNQQQQHTGNSTFNTAVPTTKQSASIQPDVQLSQIQLSVPDENTNVPSPNNGDQGESNPFTKIQLRKTVTNDRSAPIIPRDYQLGEFARH